MTCILPCDAAYVPIEGIIICAEQAPAATADDKSLIMNEVTFDGSDEGINFWMTKLISGERVRAASHNPVSCSLSSSLCSSASLLASSSVFIKGRGAALTDLACSIKLPPSLLTPVLPDLAPLTLVGARSAELSPSSGPLGTKVLVVILPFKTSFPPPPSAVPRDCSAPAP